MSLRYGSIICLSMVFVLLAINTGMATDTNYVEGPVYNGTDLHDIIGLDNSNFIEMNSSNFEGFLPGEVLRIYGGNLVSDRTINEDGVFYTTEITEVDFKGDFDPILYNKYPILGLFGEKYVPLTSTTPDKLAKLVIDSDMEYTINTGDSLDLGSGYVLTPLQIDVEGDKVWMELSKDGEFVEDEVIDVTEGDTTWVYDADVANENDVEVMRVHITLDLDNNSVIIEGLWLIDADNVLEIESGNELGILEVDSIGFNSLSMVNEDPITLTPGSILEIAGDLKFKVSDSDEYLMFYLTNEYFEPEPPKTITVDDDGTADFTLIQDAVNYANNGDTILVYPGFYEENVDVDKELTIMSEYGNPTDTIVQASNPEENVFHVNADNVTISGFSLKGAKYGFFWPVAGIYLDGVYNNTVSNNILFNNEFGIFLASSDYNLLINNTIESNEWTGITFELSNYNVLSNNKAISNRHLGIDLYESWNNVLRDNIMSNNTYNFGVEAEFIDGYYNDIDVSNLVDEKPIYYLVNVSDMIIDSASNAGTLYCINCQNISISDLSLQNNSNGIYLYNTNNSNLYNIAASNNHLGIVLFESVNNTMRDNVVSENDFGIVLGESRNNTLINNNALNNIWGGVSLFESENNGLTENTILGNEIGIALTNANNNIIYNNYFNNTQNFNFYYSSTENIWNTTKTVGTSIVGGPFLGGNYWANPNGTGFSQIGEDLDGDGICDSPCYIDESNIDYLPLYTGPEEPKTITVDDDGTADFTSIQDAVDYANNGDTILVYPGTYVENVDVNVINLTIRSQSGNPEDTIVRAADSNDHVFNITADNVTISGFTVTGATAKGGIKTGDRISPEMIAVKRCTFINNILSNNGEGITIGAGGGNHKLLNNSIISNHGYGINLFYSGQNEIIDNNISNNGGGISFGIDSPSNNVTNNIISDNRGHGIDYPMRSRSVITDNIISNNSNGIDLYDMASATLINNSIHSNRGSGIYARESCSVTLFNNTIRLNKEYGISLIYSNAIAYNNYFNNTNNTLISTGITGVWNTTKTPGTNIVGGPYLGGNYWASPNGTSFSQIGEDLNGDGICDSPCYIDENNTDYLPLYKGPEPSKTIAVDDDGTADFTSIQDAVDYANDGDTIVVYPGTYTENVDVNKELTIISESGNPEDTIVQAADRNDHVFDVTADNVIISGFSVECATGYRKAGIHLNEVEGCNISNNTLSNNEFGINLDSSSDNLLKHNDANSNKVAGIRFLNSSNNILSGNVANSNNYYGIVLCDSCDNNTLSSNIASNNEYGLWMCATNNNLIYDNYFNNTNNIYLKGINENIWNTTNTSGPNIIGGPYLGGNYWADPDGTGFSQICEDADEDGFCDSPYCIDENNIDYLPLSEPFDPMCYDINDNGIIEKNEAIEAIIDYFDDRIEKNEVFEVITLYFNS